MDPVIASDGHSYERESIEEWFRLGRITSPVTGVNLETTNLLPNHNLNRVIQDHLKRSPESRSFSGSPLYVQSAYKALFGVQRFCAEDNAPKLRGTCLTTSQDLKIAIRSPGSSFSWPDTTIFVAGTVRLNASETPCFGVEVLERVSGYNGLQIGLLCRDPKGFVGDMDALVGGYGYYIDTAGWFRAPHIEAKLSGWYPQSVKTWEQVSVVLSVPEAHFQVFVDTQKVLDIPTNFPLLDKRGGPTDIRGFVSLTGVHSKLRLLSARGPPGSAEGDDALIRQREDFIRQTVLQEAGVNAPSYGSQPPEF